MLVPAQGVLRAACFRAFPSLPAFHSSNLLQFRVHPRGRVPSRYSPARFSRAFVRAAVTLARKFVQIARGDAATLSEVLQRDIDAPLLSAAFPDWPVQAYFEFAPSVSDQASRVVQDAVTLAGAGYAMEPGELSEKTGYALSGA